jgi:hypothetical protein
VHQIHRVAGPKCLSWGAEALEDGLRCRWFLEVPFRMRAAELQIALRTRGAPGSLPRAFFSRFEGGRGAYALPLTVMSPGPPGHGERKNPEGICAPELGYAAVRVPSGGRFSLILELPRGSGELEQAWVAGYEAPTREAGMRARPPHSFGATLPVQHPLGFGVAVQLDIGRA